MCTSSVAVGENGFTSRIQPIQPESCLLSGITTVVGLLGSDSTTKTVCALLAYTKELNQLGINAYCLTGSYTYPSPTLTGSVTDDIAFIDEILGVKIALSDHRSSYLSKEELMRLASQVRMGALLSKKAGIITIHLGKEKQGLNTVIDFLQQSDFPITHFKPTHCGNRLDEAVRFGKMGGHIDFSTGIDLNITADQILSVPGQVAEELITISTDANGSIPIWDSEHRVIGMGRGKIHTMLELLRIFYARGIALEEFLPWVTSNVAQSLGLGHRKGKLQAQMDADVVLMEEGLQVSTVLCRGEVLVRDGVSCFTPFYMD